MRFLVTGGAGFIGGHIAETLLKRNLGAVIVYDNLSVGRQENIPEGCRFIEGDIRDSEKLTKALAGVDVVFHNAAFVSIRDSYTRLWDELEINCSGMLNLLEAMVKQGVKKIIFASSMAAYGKPKYIPIDEGHELAPISPYGFSKARSELYCRIFSDREGITSIILRYCNAYGIKQTPSPYVGVLTTFINQALRGEPLTVYGDGSQIKDFVNVNDIVQANMLAIDYPESEVFNVGSGIQTSVDQLADLVIQNIDNARKIYLKPPEGEVDSIQSDISKAKRLLGYQPQVVLQDALPGIIEWWRGNQGAYR